MKSQVLQALGKTPNKKNIDISSLTQFQQFLRKKDGIILD